jgi:4-nitrophenyl phosphatase
MYGTPRRIIPESVNAASPEMGRNGAFAIIGCMTLELNEIEDLIVDMDGVLWHGETALPGLADFFATLNELGIGFMLATNNATRVASQYTDKLARFGVTVPPEQILTSAEVTASHLAHHYPPQTTVYVVGEDGLRLALARHGFDLLPTGGLVAPGTRAGLVVVGLDRQACWEQLASAAYLIQNGAHFIGTNGDVTFPTEAGPLPGAGALLALLETATGVAPEIMGKPERAVFEEALSRLGATAATTAMVGDRLETDIAGAQAAGLPAILVLSGVTHRDQLAPHPVQPELVCQDIRELALALREARQEVVGGRQD